MKTVVYICKGKCLDILQNESQEFSCLEVSSFHVDEFEMSYDYSFWKRRGCVKVPCSGAKMRGGVGGVSHPPNNFNTRSQLQFDGDKSVPLWACMYRISVYNTLSCKQLCRCCDSFALTYFLGWTDLITGYWIDPVLSYHPCSLLCSNNDHLLHV